MDFEDSHASGNQHQALTYMSSSTVDSQRPLHLHSIADLVAAQACKTGMHVKAAIFVYKGIMYMIVEFSHVPNDKDIYQPRSLFGACLPAAKLATCGQVKSKALMFC